MSSDLKILFLTLYDRKSKSAKERCSMFSHSPGHSLKVSIFFTIFFSSVKNGSYKSKLSLKFHHAIATSLIYRDIVIFEGKPTGINNEYSLKLNPEETKMDFSFSFETPYFVLPKISGWYSVRAMITDRFEQIWFEWSFQFHVDDE